MVHTSQHPVQNIIITLIQHISGHDIKVARRIEDSLNPFPNKPWFLRVCSTSLSNHLENPLPFSSNLKLSSANSFSLEESEICRLGKG